MPIGDLVAMTSHGLFSSGGGGTCDYPAESDVRDGVAYAFGASTGNVVLPGESDVVAGVDYGSDGTEFTGTFSCPAPPTPPTPIRPRTNGTYPFAAIARAITDRVGLMLGLDLAYIHSVANDKYKVTEAEPLFVYCQWFGVAKPRDPALEYTDAGAGNLFRPVARRMRCYLYTRSGEDVYATDDRALFGEDPNQDFDTPPVYPGHFVAEEVLYSALNDWVPISSSGTALTLGPLHPLDASEEPQRPPEGVDGLLRSCLDWEVVYILCTDQRDPASS